MLKIYKNKNKKVKNEQKYGDVAFLVRRYFNGGSFVDGVGLCEAKRIYDNGEFSSINNQQLTEMNKNAANHKLLLYVKNTMPNGKLLRLTHCEFCWPYHHIMPNSLAGTQPSINAIARKTKKHSELNGDAIPLAYQIISKYFEGFDLDYRENVLADIKTGDGSCDYIVSGVIGYDKADGLQYIDVDGNVYDAIQDES